ncbi:hypothetical protein CLAFUW4_12817 [Fulvia fulva]|uniref:Uncharacterized protein n=1 Tax=Passalora fulva TaxID=5499 RepID=A0A9Q8PJI8_PASFU|nr:uncharacterized protein CLAFUR5_12685 [Fulvia fulva]KAK4611916.1 hypothetical protein CLAFUR4_12821 [Fulvia fulva]KAK4612438.1 hypothetical protein CLAFUR0_12827 [Fulvia fulva]UJO23819.1 hypothetical protein CLAFUR5_12685 [Fulvia fulva]WPV20851.1 hypothetical protein CLAFUW4_12817 [Fulvia fulva]WPV35974.1 hypothetical protein CLAFUW7_12825 [Fulvia fulva]
MAVGHEAMDTSPRQDGEKAKHSFLDTKFVVLLPEMPELRLTRDEFTSYIRTMCSKSHDALASAAPADDTEGGASTPKSVSESGDDPLQAPFMTALLSVKAAVPTVDERDGKMLTENEDVAYRTTDPLVDLFYELESVVSGSRLRQLLAKAWQHDSEMTLKIIWNARSIHLGKSNRQTFYRAIGWLYQYHPVTMLLNLPWLVRPVIQKKVPKPEDGNKTGHAPSDTNVEHTTKVASAAEDDDSDFEMVDYNAPVDKPATKKAKLNDIPELSDFDVRYGGAHGYWKDLLNILALAAKDELRGDGDPRKVLNVDNRQEKPAQRFKPANSKKEVDKAQYAKLMNEKLIKNSSYTALHMTVARLFAEQLQLDMQRLESGTEQDLKAISMVGKWAPTHKESHDRATRVVSSIAEIMFPFQKVCPDIDPADRTLYLKYARQEYHFRVLPKLRKHLQIVERPVTANKFEEIQYDRVPSLAMKAYTPLFARKDFDHFDKYIENVAQGKAQISGATLMPSTLIHDVTTYPTIGGRKSTATDQLVVQKLYDTRLKALEGQWKTLVQRIKDSGTLESSIAVCDVSGSMSGPQFPDGTTPMDSSVALSLLLAEVTKPPFGGAFITFSEQPQIMHAGGVDDKRSLKEKVDYILRADWGGSTDFVAVFEKLILPMAIQNKLAKEDMVKQVFVFSDMQFNSANCGTQRWSTSYERIKEAYNEAGYDMPHLIFWNLAGGRAGMTGYGDETAPKPVDAAEEGTSLVSGYSQAQLKTFLDGGGFEDPEKEDVIEQVEGEDGEEVVVQVKKQKQDPLDTVKKAVSHEAYRMLKVMD